MKSYDVINPIKLPGSHDIVVTGVVYLDDATAALLLATGSIRSCATTVHGAETVAPVGETQPPVSETDTSASNVTPLKPGRRK